VAAAVIAVTFVVAAYFAHTWTRRGATQLATAWRAALFEHVQHLSVDFFARSRVGELAGRIGQDIERLEAAIWLGLSLVWSSAMLVIGVALIAWVDGWMALLALALLAIAAAWTLVVLPRLRHQTRGIRDDLGATSGTLHELLGMSPLLKAFNAEDTAVREVRQAAGRVQQGTEALARLQHRYSDPLGLHLAFVAPFILLFVGAWRTAGGTMSIGDVVAIWGFWIRGSGAMTMLMTNVPEVLAGLTAGERAAELLDEEPLVCDRPNAVPLQVSAGAVRFDRIGFAYPGRPAARVLDGFDLRIEPGERVALVGASGAGKSTVAQLMLRFYDPDEGSVSIDGVDLRDVQQHSVRRAVGVVFQDSVLLSGSLARNLRLGAPDATDDELRAALEAANALAFVEAWEHGIDTEVGERGVTLSGGQRQRLAIARVMLKDPRVVVLDEATSALDATSERAVLAALDTLLEGRTSLVIAHRIATVRDADRIVVVEHGRVAEVGSHAALRRSSTTYRTFCEEQHVA
jgi:ABC-type multidrug transport system fused ATPase/permease subunit